MREDKLDDLSVELSIVKVKYKDELVYVLFDNDESTIYKKDGEIVLSTTEDDFEFFSINHDIDCYFDYDNIPLENPINADDVLNKWNFLHDIATAFGMHFEGNEQKYTRSYDYLFHCATAIDKKELYWLPQDCILSIKKVFGKKHRQLNRLFQHK